MINPQSPFFRQARLVARVLPWVAKADCFALKGGTAINLFIRNMPRLSVDIDLTYLPVQSRDVSLAVMESALIQIARDIERSVPQVAVRKARSHGLKIISKLHISNDGVQIKIEPNFVIRGTVFPSEVYEMTMKARDMFETTVSSRLVSLGDLYGGKICAALDRQHPRDLYDVKYLLDNEGLTEQIRKGFLVYWISHDRPIHESLEPVMKDFRDVYESEFQGMPLEDVAYEELVTVRAALVDGIRKALSADEKDFLLSFKTGDPDWALLGIDGVENLPAVRWKVMNLRKMEKSKRADFVERLRHVLGK